jgi:tripartite ATP-independent transporter DctP family solute receptor
MKTLSALSALSTFAAGLALLAASASPALAQAHKLKLGHASSAESSQQVALVKFAQLVKERSKGEVEITVYPASTLGPDAQLINLTRGGSIDIAVSGSTNFNGIVAQTAALELPYVFRDSKHAYAVLDGKIGQDLLDELGKHSLKGLAYFENGWRVLTNNRRPVLVPEDAKGLKVRSTPNPYHIQAFQLLGMNPSPMAIAELYQALESKAFDAQEHPLPVFWSSKFYEVQKYLTLTNHAYSPTMAVMNKAKFDGLPPQHQKVLVDSARDAVAFHRELNAKDSQKIIGELRKLGIHVVETPNLAPFSAMVAPVRKSYIEKNGADLINAIDAVK